MPILQQNPAFTWYAITCLVLCLNLIALWVYSGSARSRTGTAINPEDSERFKARLAETDPPTVARVLRAHRNAEASIYPFLILGLVYVLGGGGARTAAVVFGIFTAARLVHSWAYVTGRQPLRSICFGIGGVALLGLMVCVVLQLIPQGGAAEIPVKGS